MFDALPLGIAVLDAELRYRAVNKALAAMNRVSSQAHLGKTIRDVIGKPAVTLEAPFKHVVFSGRHVSLEFWAKLLKRKQASHWIVNYFPIAGAKGRAKLVGAVVVENARQNQAQQLFRGVADKLIQNLVLTAHDSDALLRQVMEGSLGQSSDARANRNRSAGNGLSNQMPLVARQAMQDALRVRSESDANATASAMALTPRERDVVKLLAEGTGNKETAASLGITVKTVETHRARIMLKLGLHSTRELVHYALRNKILVPVQ
ncbi:MAG TPA: LuxR C-terminal-related transcriptional regulator [Candidatus Acidoferrales bacterium]